MVAAGAAALSWRASRAANHAAGTLAAIERDRRHSELCPQFRLTWQPAHHAPKLRVTLLGPPTLTQIDSLTVSIRNDIHTRGEGQLLAGSATQDQVKNLIWGPYRFRPGTGPGEARADDSGRATSYQAALPVGEQLTYQLEPTAPGGWMRNTTQDDWMASFGGTVRLALEAGHAEHGSWTIPAELDTASNVQPITVTVPLSVA